MFCTKCGSELNEGVKFCNNCGNQILGTELAKDVIPNTMASNRNSIIADIENARAYVLEAENYYQQSFALQGSKNHFVEIGNTLNDYYDIFKIIFLPLIRLIHKSNAKLAVKEIENYMNEYKINYSYKKTAKIIAVIGYIIAFLVLIFGTSFLYSEIGVLISVCVAFLVGCAGEIVYLVAIIRYRNAAEKALYNKMAEIDNNCSDLYNTAYAKLTDYKRAYGIIPDKYLNSYSLNYIKDALENCRADSLKEAINLFEDYNMKQEMIRQNDKHYQEIMQQQQAMFKQYRKDQLGNDIADALILFSLAFN